MSIRIATRSGLASAAARALVPSARRSTAALAKQQYSSSAVSLGGATPPLAPFARIPPESEKMVEQYDAIWDDGVAPEVTLDFDCAHISSGEGLASWLGGLSLFVVLYNVVKATDPQSKNPAANRQMHIVGGDPAEATREGWKVLKEGN
ncbi:hypothetical protein ACHAWF_016766 [Thalassiosira exigua]